MRISDWSSDVCSSDLVSDDDANKVYVVDQANPTVKLAEFSTDTFGSTRTSDITMAPDGNLFILDQATRTIYQTTTDGTLVAGTPLPSKLKRPADRKSTRLNSSH